ncbi:MAG: biopolymer transporter ExbD [Rhodobacteraceae bacterium]|nr:biopolymer transporter ExbD [Paracoccaceae bacterium]
MRRRSRERRSDEEERVLPLINIVFLLLIFFMVVGKISASDPFEITPTQSASEGAPPMEPLMVQIGGEGQLALNGAVLDEASLLAAVEAAIARDQASDVRVKADGGVEAADVVRLLERLQAVGVNGVRLMTVPAP